VILRPSNTNPPRALHALSLLIFAALACNIYGVPDTPAPPPAAADVSDSTPAPAPAEPTPEPTLAPDVDYQGIQFSYDDALAGYVNMEVVPGRGSGETAEWDYTPDYVQFTFGDYLLPDTFHEARIIIVPVEGYKAVNTFGGQVIDELAGVLAGRPALPAGELPFLPLWNAGALIQSNAAFLDFQNGSGVRYLTQHGQAHWPINNHDLFYTFQGLTADGRYFVSAILPISHPQLQATGDDIPGGDYAAFGDNFLGYVADIKNLLEGQAGESFTPSLEMLDAVMESLLVDWQ
jgi:hypothetical protein